MTEQLKQNQLVGFCVFAGKNLFFAGKKLYLPGRFFHGKPFFPSGGKNLPTLADQDV